MTYDVKKIKEIADRLGVSEKTVIQYIRACSLTQSGGGEASRDHAVERASGAPPARWPTPGSVPGRLHG